MSIDPTPAQSWLLVFDNVEHQDQLADCWPESVNGSILVTARNPALMYHPSTGGYIIPRFTREEGSKFIMRLLSRGKYSEDEMNSARDLSELLDGWALALFQSSRNIMLARTRIGSYLHDCKADPQMSRKTLAIGSQNSFYSYSIETVFQKPFEHLTERSSYLLGVVCFIAPIDIPEEMFNSLDSGRLPHGLQFCSKPIE
jgi:hypothetical protein